MSARMSRRDADPETWLEDRADDRRLDDESDRRGTRGERDLEALVYGETYRDRYNADQARKRRDLGGAA